MFDCVVVCRAFIPESLPGGHGSEVPSVMMLVVKNQDSVKLPPRRLQLHHHQTPVLILPAGTILMGKCTIANGMVMLFMMMMILILKDALLMDTCMKMKVRQRMKHAVHAVEGKWGALVQLPPP